MKIWRIVEFVDELEQSDFIKYDNITNKIFENNIKEKILCIGQVQSGKTRKIIDCIKYSLFKKRYDIVIFVAGTNNRLYEQSKQRILDSNFDKNIKILFKEDISKYSYRQGQQYLLVISKGGNGKDLTNALDFLTPIDVKNKNILFIDDESDYASINNNKGSTSVIYEKMTDSWDRVKNGKYLLVTATPFANLISLNSMIMRPNRVVVWGTNEDYYGLEKFNNSNVYEIVHSNKDDENSYTNDVEKVIDYFIKTLLLNYPFFKEIIKKEISCLFNISLKTDVHKKIYEKVESIINRYRNNLDSFFQKENIENNLENKKKLMNILCDETSIILLNEENKDVTKPKKFNIYISGVMASRGNTFENLLCQLNINSPLESKLSVDTLLQRCRWFGYRNNIFKYMKIFVNNDIYQSLLESKKYLDLLTPGFHNPEDLCRKIKLIDTSENTIYVKSTSKG